MTKQMIDNWKPNNAVEAMSTINHQQIGIINSIKKKDTVVEPEEIVKDEIIPIDTNTDIVVDVKFGLLDINQFDKDEQ